MIVVKRGELPEDNWYQCKCNHCQSILEFQMHEVTRTDNQRDGTTLHFTCPVCQKKADAYSYQFVANRPKHKKTNSLPNAGEPWLNQGAKHR